jgi:hypothetical protein
MHSIWSLFWTAGDNRFRDKMAEAIEAPSVSITVRQQLGFLLQEPVRELVFLTNRGPRTFELSQPGSKATTGRPLSSSYAGVNSFE